MERRLPLDEAEETPPIVVRKEVKTSEQLKAEQEMLANLEKESFILNYPLIFLTNWYLLYV